MTGLKGKANLARLIEEGIEHSGLPMDQLAIAGASKEYDDGSLHFRGTPITTLLNSAANKGESANADTDRTLIFPGSLATAIRAIENGLIPLVDQLVCYEDDQWVTASKLVDHYPPIKKLDPRFLVSLLDGKLGYEDRPLFRRYQPWVDQRERAFTRLLSQLATFPGKMPYVVTRRLLFCIGSLNSGGAERQIVNTIGGLRDRGIQDLHLLVENLDLSEADRFYKERADSYARVFTLDTFDVDEQWLGWCQQFPDFVDAFTYGMTLRMLKCVEVIREIGPEVLHVSLDWSNVLMGLSAVLAGVPNIFISGRNVGPRHFNFYQPFMYPAYRALLACPNVHMTNNSEGGRRDYCEWLGIEESKVGIVRNGLSLEEFAVSRAEDGENIRRELNIASDSQIVLGVFRICDEKQPLLWIETAKKIQRARPRACFALCGHGPLQESVLAYADKIGLENFYFLGVRSDIRDVIAGCDLVLQTSKFEGTPNTLIEAQAIGIPVVTTPAFGAAEAVEDGVTGFVVDSASAAVIAKTCVRVLDDQILRENVKEAGPQFSHETFSFDRMIDNTLASYYNVGVKWTSEYTEPNVLYGASVDISSFTSIVDKTWAFHLPEYQHVADTEKSQNSPFMILEDGKLLGPGHCGHEELAREGMGRYSHWDEYFYFSTSDGSDPNANRRKYSLVVEHDRAGELSRDLPGAEQDLNPKRRYGFRLKIGAFEYVDGETWSCFLPDYSSVADSVDAQNSPFELLEDGVPLGPGHCEHEVLKLEGAGRYSHWGKFLYFSASDGSDPNTNDKEYSLAVDSHRTADLQKLRVLKKQAARRRKAEKQASVKEAKRQRLANKQNPPRLKPKEVAKRDAPAEVRLEPPAPLKKRIEFELKIEEFNHVSGETWGYYLPQYSSFADTVKVQDSPFELQEDGVFLGPGHCGHDELNAEGGGRYSHWGDFLYFSTSDGSDPNTNGRDYRLVVTGSSDGILKHLARAKSNREIA